MKFSRCVGGLSVPLVDQIIFADYQKIMKIKTAREENLFLSYDTKSAINPAEKAFEKYPAIQRFYDNNGYCKSFEENVSGQLGLGADISKRKKFEFEVLPLRWRVERTFS